MFKLLLAFVVFGVINANYYHLNNNDDNEEDGYSMKQTFSDNWKNSHNSDEEEEHHSHRVPIAIKTKRYHRVIPVHSEGEEAHEKVVEVHPYRQPFRIIFKTKSNPVKIEQIHEGNPGGTESSKSEDEPHRVHHEVLRPVIQEIREIIQPYRRVVQEVRPVLEELKTIVSKNDGNGRESSEESNGSQNSYKRRQSKQREQRMRSKPIMQLSYNEDSMKSSDDNNSEKKQRYQTERTVSEDSHKERSYSRGNDDSSEGKSKESRKYRRFTNEDSVDTSSILGQMNKIMAGNTLQVEHSPVAEQYSDIGLSSLNAGNLKLSQRIGELVPSEDYSRGFYFTHPYY